MPSMDKIGKLLEVSQKYAKEAGLTRKDVARAIRKVRREKGAKAKIQ